MLKSILMFMGWGFLAIGLVGFFAPGFLGAHLNVAHNLIHLVTGGLALWMGSAGVSINAAKKFAIGFGLFYGLLGVVGFLIGSGPGNVLALMPGILELGTVDHLLHIVFGIVFLVGAFAGQSVSKTTHKGATA